MPSFGKGRHKTEKWWKALGYMLCDGALPGGPLLEDKTFSRNGATCGKTYLATTTGKKFVQDQKMVLKAPLSPELLMEDSKALEAKKKIGNGAANPHE